MTDATIHDLRWTDFKEGDRVRHPSMGAGTVERVRNGRIQVLYDALSKRGREQRGLYDDKWLANVGLLEKVEDAP